MSTEERLAILETQMEAVEKDISEIKTMVTSLVANTNKSKGFWGGVLFAGTVVGGFLQFAIGYFLKQNG